MHAITKTLRWEMGHRLSLHPGLCRNLHGHSYEARLTLRAFDLDAFGMVRDFGDFAPLKGWIAENLDHAMLLHEGDERGMEACAQVPGQRIYLLQDHPTAEAIAMLLHRHACRLMDVPDTLLTVVVYETATSSAGYAP